MLDQVKRTNFILATDTYKFSHVFEMPSVATNVYSVIVPRKPSEYATEIVAMGQSYVAHILQTTRITQEDIDEAEFEVNSQGYEFNRAGWQYILDKYEGRIPLQMWGVEEGQIVPPQTPIVAFYNTDPKLAWLTSYIEPWALSTVWKMSTVASAMRSCRQIAAKYIRETGADMANLDYAVHNFGDRGADSPNEAVVLAGIAHAAIFKGSDAARVNRYVRELFNGSKDEVYTSSVEATEHSVTTMNSFAEGETDFGAAQMVVGRLKAAVERANRGIGIPVVSAVIDTYDSRRYVRQYAGNLLKDQILETGGVLVFRPDSGDPTVEPSLVAKDVEDTFGIAGLTSTGHKILNRSTKVIQGDGLSVRTIDNIMAGWTKAGYSMDSFLVGMGGGVTNHGSRDDFSFSMKATAWAQRNKPTWTLLLKNPKTDASKRSLSGLVYTTVVNGVVKVHTMPLDTTIDKLVELKAPGWVNWYNANSGTRHYQKFSRVRELASK